MSYLQNWERERGGEEGEWQFPIRLQGSASVPLHAAGARHVWHNGSLCGCSSCGFEMLSHIQVGGGWMDESRGLQFNDGKLLKMKGAKEESSGGSVNTEEYWCMGTRRWSVWSVSSFLYPFIPDLAPAPSSAWRFIRSSYLELRSYFDLPSAFFPPIYSTFTG